MRFFENLSKNPTCWVQKIYSTDHCALYDLIDPVRRLVGKLSQFTVERMNRLFCNFSLFYTRSHFQSNIPKMVKSCLLILILRCLLIFCTVTAKDTYGTNTKNLFILLILLFFYYIKTYAYHLDSKIYKIVLQRY